MADVRVGRAGRESWRNASEGYVVVGLYDRRGDVEHQIIPAGGTILLTPEDRSMSQDAAASEDLDIFSNGMMVPVRLLETTEDKAEIESNPNLKSEDDLKEMFSLQWKKFEAEVGLIGNVTTLSRLKQLAQSEGIDATVRQVNTIESRINELNPESAVTDVTMQQYGSTVGAKEPRGTRIS